MNKYTFVDALNKIPKSSINEDFYTELWTAMANGSIVRTGLKKEEYTKDDICSFSFRGAGGIVANLWNKNNPGKPQKDYLDYYCCNEAPYGTVTEYVSKVVGKFGWGFVDTLPPCLGEPNSPSNNASQWMINNGYVVELSNPTINGKYLICYAKDYDRKDVAGQLWTEVKSSEFKLYEPSGVIYKINNYGQSDAKVGKILYSFKKDGKVEYELPNFL